jgi:hypothetical protein
LLPELWNFSTVTQGTWLSKFSQQPGPNGRGRMARGGHGLPKVSPGPAMRDTSIARGKATPYGHFRGGPPAGRAACSRLLPFLDTPRGTPMLTARYGDVFLS